MNIVSANYTESGSINVVTEGQPADMFISVPPDPNNKDYIALQEWAAEGDNEIKAYVAPPEADPEPTLEERVAALEAKIGK